MSADLQRQALIKGWKNPIQHVVLNELGSSTSAMTTPDTLRKSIGARLYLLQSQQQHGQ